MQLRSPRSAQTVRDPVHHPVFARWYARFRSPPRAARGWRTYGAELLRGLSGRVIEIGAGNGLNFAYYPGTVSEVVAMDPERALRALAVEAALRADVPVDVAWGWRRRCR
ncbi:SAM-dependent methyltransferase OS=Streptomyces albaduncus OX=68172 GN=FHS32_002186 PE=4 SV=1 [Streptomyces griseoloalbus]